MLLESDSLDGAGRFTKTRGRGVFVFADYELFNLFSRLTSRRFSFFFPGPIPVSSSIIVVLPSFIFFFVGGSSMAFELSFCLGTVVENWVFFRGTFFLTLISVFEHSFLETATWLTAFCAWKDDCPPCLASFSLAKTWANRRWWFLCSW